MTTNQIQLDKTHMRAESHATGEGMAFVFDDTAHVARVIDGVLLRRREREEQREAGAPRVVDDVDGERRVDGLDERCRPAEHGAFGGEVFYKAFDLEERHHDTSLSRGALIQRDA